MDAPITLQEIEDKILQGLVAIHKIESLDEQELSKLEEIMDEHSFNPFTCLCSVHSYSWAKQEQAYGAGKIKQSTWKKRITDEFAALPRDVRGLDSVDVSRVSMQSSLGNRAAKAIYGSQSIEKNSRIMTPADLLIHLRGVECNCVDNVDLYFRALCPFITEYTRLTQTQTAK